MAENGKTLGEVMAGPSTVTLTWEPEVLEALHPVAVKVYLVLVGSGATEVEGVAIGRAELTDRVGMKNLRSVDRHVRDLEAAGYVVVDRTTAAYGPRHKNTYYVKALV